MTICRRKLGWATVLLVCVFAAGSVSLVYQVAGRCAMGGADINIGRSINSHTRGSIFYIHGWEQFWPPMTTPLRVTYTKGYPKVSSKKLSITYDSNPMPLISQATQQVRHSDRHEVTVAGRYPLSKHTHGLNASGYFHIQF